MSRKILLILIFLGILFLIPFFQPKSSFAACSANWSLRGTDDRDWSVVYHLTLSDNCSGANNYDVRVTNRTSNQPKLAGGNSNDILRFNWEYGTSAGDNNPVSVSITDSRNIDITVKRVRTVFHKDGEYRWVSLRASNSEASDIIQLGYVVENKPDLEVVPRFTFADGCINTKSSPVTLKITNSGWVSIPSKSNGGGFWVRVHNGVGDYFDYEVTQRIDRGEVIDLTKKLSNEVNIPGPAGKHTARAIIDVRGDILEEDNFSENNNKANFEYQSRNCAPTNPPPTDPPITDPPPPTITDGPPPPPNPNADGWIQGIGGDMRYDHGLFNNIVSSDINKFFSETVFGKVKHGIVFLASPFNLSAIVNDTTKANENKQVVKDSPFKEIGNMDELNTSYTNVVNNLRKSGNLSNAKNLSTQCGGPLNNCNLSTSITQGIYTAEGDVDINSTANPFTFIAGANHKYYIFLIEGNLTIKNNIKVEKGTTAIFIVGGKLRTQGDITIDKNVTLIEGIYSADKNFMIESKAPSPDDILNINGSIIANAKKRLELPGIGIFSGKRDLGKVRNGTTAGIQINYRPDFALNSPLLLRSPNSKRIEVAPGQ